jgi:nitroreductase
MQPISTDALISSLNWRYAVKKFDAAKKIPAATWEALESSLLLSPSSYGLQPWRFVVVKDAAVRAQLRPHSWNQPQITDASHMVVLAAKKEVTVADIDAYVERIMQVRGVPREALDGYRGMMVGSLSNPAGLSGGSVALWAQSQVYIALGVFLTSCAVLGIDACPMEGIDTKKYDEILDLPAQGYHAIVVATAGYRAADDGLATMKKVRAPREAIIKHR